MSTNTIAITLAAMSCGITLSLWVPQGFHIPLVGTLTITSLLLTILTVIGY